MRHLVLPTLVLVTLGVPAFAGGNSAELNLRSLEAVREADLVELERLASSQAYQLFTARDASMNNVLQVAIVQRELKKPLSPKGTPEFAREKAFYDRYLEAMDLILGAAGTEEDRLELVNDRDGNRRTALHIAGQKCDAEAAALLLKQGAEVRSTDLRGKTPVDLVDDNLIARSKQGVKPGTPEHARYVQPCEETKKRLAAALSGAPQAPSPAVKSGTSVKSGVDTPVPPNPRNAPTTSGKQPE